MAALQADDNMRWPRIFIVIFLLAGCNLNPAPVQPDQTPDLFPYFTRTPGMAAATLVPPVPLTATQLPVTSPTPFTYSIVPNDTASSIARRFGISVDVLMAANPGMNSELLVIGQKLTIPPASNPGTAMPSLSTPVPPGIGLGFCQPSGGGIICILPVHNPYTWMLEDVRLHVNLFDTQGQPLASQETALPLNILPPGKDLPASVFFNAVTGPVFVQGQLISSIRLSEGDNRYLRTSIQNQLVSIAWDGLSAKVQGKILLSDTAKPAASIWLVGVAYTASGQIAGYRRWEWSGSLQPGASQAFAFSVYSLGLPIQQVDVLVEARP